MTLVFRCDGPNCTKTATPGYAELHWKFGTYDTKSVDRDGDTHVQRGDRVFTFCSRLCVDALQAQTNGLPYSRKRGHQSWWSRLLDRRMLAGFGPDGQGGS